MTREEKLAKLKGLAKKNTNTDAWRAQAQWNKEHEESLKDYNKIAARIAITLKEKRMSQAQLAKELGVSAQALTRIMQGRQNLTLHTIRKIEQALDISLIQVLENKPVRTKVIWQKVTVYHSIPVQSDQKPTNIQEVDRRKSKRILKVAI